MGRCRMCRVRPSSLCRQLDTVARPASRKDRDLVHHNHLGHCNSDPLRQTFRVQRPWGNQRVRIIAVHIITKSVSVDIKSSRVTIVIEVIGCTDSISVIVDTIVRIESLPGPSACRIALQFTDMSSLASESSLSIAKRTRKMFKSKFEFRLVMM